MLISPIYNYANTNLVQNRKPQKRNFRFTTDCVNFNGRIIPNELKDIDFSKLSENSLGVLDVINTGTFAQILKFNLQDKTYAVKRLYPYKITQPKDLLPKKRPSLEQQLKNEIAIYKKLKGVKGVPQLYLYNAGDKSNLLNNYIVTSWAEGKSRPKMVQFMIPNWFCLIFQKFMKHLQSLIGKVFYTEICGQEIFCFLKRS